MPRITLGTCRWTNKEHFPGRMYSSSMRGTEVAATEGQWLHSKLPECSAPKTEMTALRLMCTLLIYPCMLCISIMFMMSWSSASLFWQEKHCACVGEPCQFTCAPAGIPTDCFLQLCMSHLINSVSQILSLWHSPPGISVCPHTGVCNLLKTACKTIHLQKMIYEMDTVINNNKRGLQELRMLVLLTTKW